MSAAAVARRLPSVLRLHGLRQQRLRTAEAEAADARAAVWAREAELAAADARIAAVDARRAEIERWFQSCLDTRHIDAALAHRASMADDRAREDELRARAATALDEARRDCAAALRRLARARARLDLVAGHVHACRRAVEALGEAAAEEAYEDRARTRRAPGFLGAAA